MIAVKKFAKLQFLCVLSKSLPLTPGFLCAKTGDNGIALRTIPLPQGFR